MSARRLETDELKQLALKAVFKAGKLAKLLSSSPRQMRRDFNQQLGEPPARWLRELRSQEARKLILCGHSQKEVVNRLGFADAAHLSREIKTFYGVTANGLKRSTG